MPNNLIDLLRDYLQAVDTFQMDRVYELRKKLRKAVKSGATKATDNAERAAGDKSAAWITP